jgi:hypothetical protein
MDSVKKSITKNLSNMLDALRNNKTYAWVFSILVAITITYSIPNLPNYIKDLFNNHITRFLVFSTALYISTGDPVVSISVSLTLVIVYWFLTNGTEFFELIKPDTDSHLGCLDVTAADLLNKFDGDEEKLRNAMFNAGVPSNLYLDDIDAPEIATYLINAGYGQVINDTCKLPQ